MNRKEYFLMYEADLRVAVFGEGIPPRGENTVEDDKICSVTVYMDEEKTEMPFGMIENQPFLELFWRETGADCDGEEEEMKFPDGQRYRICLKDTR